MANSDVKLVKTLGTWDVFVAGVALVAAASKLVFSALSSQGSSRPDSLNCFEEMKKIFAQTCREQTKHNQSFLNSPSLESSRTIF